MDKAKRAAKQSGRQKPAAYCVCGASCRFIRGCERASSSNRAASRRSSCAMSASRQPSAVRRQCSAWLRRYWRALGMMSGRSVVVARQRVMPGLVPVRCDGSVNTGTRMTHQKRSRADERGFAFQNNGRLDATQDCQAVAITIRSVALLFRAQNAAGVCEYFSRVGREPRRIFRSCARMSSTRRSSSRAGRGPTVVGGAEVGAVHEFPPFWHPQNARVDCDRCDTLMSF